VLPSVLPKIMSDDSCRISLINNLGRAFGLDRTTRKHGNNRSAVLNTLSEHFGVLPLVLAS
jgi:hypothetical protein